MTHAYENKHSLSDHRAVEVQSGEQPGQAQVLMRIIALMWTLVALLLPPHMDVQPKTRTPKPTAVLRWLGGKSRIARRIVALMPPHTLYVEVFGGAMHVLLSKK